VPLAGIDIIDMPDGTPQPGVKITFRSNPCL
jgi:hypothetical protein